MSRTFRRNKQDEKINKDDDHNNSNCCNCDYCRGGYYLKRQKERLRKREAQDELQ